MGLLHNLLSHPLTKGLDLDDPRTTILRKQIIRDKPLLKNIYEDWYRAVGEWVPEGNGGILEIGAGAGFAKEIIPGLYTSDVISVPGHDFVCDALRLPVKKESLKALVMVNVFHHIIDPIAFFAESYRAIRPGGRIVMIEPWATPWSRFIYRNFHHEPFDPAQISWQLPEAGPLSGGNDALPWIVFRRDDDKWQGQKDWHIEFIKECMPFRYLLSGGVSLRSLVPGFFSSPLKLMEELLPSALQKKMALFALIVLQKQTNTY